MAASSTPTLSDAWYLTGPTAGGKTATGIALARLIGAEILSLDSMAVFRSLDVGTAKPTAEERAAVPHHLIDLVDPHEDFSLAQYLDAAHAAAADVRSRGRQVLFVGGTPLYLKALLRGIFEGPPADWEFRRRLAEIVESEPEGFLHARLAAVDPASAARLHPSDERRLIRAMEVYEKTGQPMSQWQAQFDRPNVEALHVFCLDWPRDALYERINARVDAMFAAGLVEETRAVLARTGLSRTAGQALGYREVAAHLRGEFGLDETIALVKTRTRQFAKRQLTWFRSLAECRMIPVTASDDPQQIAKRICESR